MIKTCKNACTLGTAEPEEEEDDELTLALGVVAAFPSSSSSISLFLLLFFSKTIEKFSAFFYCCLFLFPKPKSLFNASLTFSKTLPADTANPTARARRHQQ